MVLLLFFITFDGSILTLCSSNITCVSSFVTFGGSLYFFFSHLIVSFSHYAVPISHFIVLLSHLVVPLFSLKFDGSIVTLGNTNIASDSTFVTFSCTLLFILKFDSSIITLGSTNITSDRTVVTFGGTLFFFLYLLIQLLQWVVPISHLTIILHLGPLLKSLFYLLITAYHNSNFLKVIKKFRSKIYKKKNASQEISPTTIITIVQKKKKKNSWNYLGFFHIYLNIPINFLCISSSSSHHI